MQDGTPWKFHGALFKQSLQRILRTSTPRFAVTFPDSFISGMLDEVAAQLGAGVRQYIFFLCII
jgi:hypothetical protein